MDNVIKDLRYSIRTLLSKPGFTVVALLTLTLAVGANTTIFSVVNAVLIRPLAYGEPERIVQVWENFLQSDLKDIPSSPPEYRDYEEQNQVFEQIASYYSRSVNLTSLDEPERVSTAMVTASFFPALGVAPVKGRAFVPEEDFVGNDKVVVVSNGLWQRRFGSDPSLIGNTLTLNGESYTVVGIMPQDFQFPELAELWTPIGFEPSDMSQDQRGSRYLSIIARLKPGVTVKQAQLNLDTLAHQFQKQYPSDYLENSGWAVTVVPLQDEILGNIQGILIIILGAGLFVLLIACANVASLLLARAAARQKEVAIRMALGADRSRLIRQFLTESLLLGLIGGALGVLLAYLGTQLLVALNPEKIPRVKEVSVDTWVLGFSLCISLLTGIIFGLAPALLASRPNMNEMLKEGSKGSSGGFRRTAHSLLVVAEVALALVLLIGAGLMINSFMRLQQVDPGFSTKNVLTMQLSLPQSKYKEGAQIGAFYQQLIQRIETLPGVQSVGAVNRLPLSGTATDRSFIIERQTPVSSEQNSSVEWRAITPNYFSALNIPLKDGRFFTEQDHADAPGVAIVNESMARRFWSGESPIGQRIKMTGPAELPWLTVVGIVGDVRHFGLDSDVKPEMYFSHLQRPWPSMPALIRTMTVVVHTPSDPKGLTSALRSTVGVMDRDLPLYNIRTMEEVFSKSIARQKFNMLLIGIFSGVALLLAAVGIYGVMAYSVSQRTREFGIRMALGAQESDVLKMVVGQGLKLVLIGVVIGLIASFVLTNLLSGVLYGISATDPITFVIVSLVLIGVALTASFVPALRATKIAPMIALREE